MIIFDTCLYREKVQNQVGQTSFETENIFSSAPSLSTNNDWYLTLRFIINGGGGQTKRGGFEDFEKLLNGEVKINGGWEQTIKEKRRIRIILKNFINFAQHRYF